LAFTIRGQTTGVSGSAGVAYPILSDNIGTPRVVLAPTNGHKRWTWEAKEAFGMQAPVENPQNDGNFVFNARFPGQWFDEETGLFQNGYRDYNPQTGRYMQSDPIGLSAGWNTYGYVGGSPVMFGDVYGLEKANLMHPRRDKNLYQAAQSFSDKKGVMMVFGHGSPTIMEDARGEVVKRLEPKKMLDLLINEYGWNGQPIMLFSCSTGKYDEGYAYQLSKLAKVPVSAPTALLWAGPQGYKGIWDRDTHYDNFLIRRQYSHDHSPLRKIEAYFGLNPLQDRPMRDNYGSWRDFDVK
jgi:RHS repeat-associated protein